MLIAVFITEMVILHKYVYLLLLLLLGPFQTKLCYCRVARQALPMQQLAYNCGARHKKCDEILRHVLKR